MMLAKSNNVVETPDLTERSAYSYIGQEILNSFPIPKIPKELK